MAFFGVFLVKTGRWVEILSFPLGGNVLYKPLDSSFRWNDGGGDKYIWATF